MAKSRVKLSEQIRRAVAARGESLRALAKATAIDPATLCRFMTGERGLPMKTLDRLADYLDLNITVGRKK